jgi:hypothetical protein
LLHEDACRTGKLGLDLREHLMHRMIVGAIRDFFVELGLQLLVLCDSRIEVRLELHVLIPQGIE